MEACPIILAILSVQNAFGNQKRAEAVPTGMPRNFLFNAASSDDFLDVLADGHIMRNGQKQVVICHTIAFLDN